MNIFLDIWHLWCQILQPKHAKTPRQNSHKDETRSSHLSQENFLQPCGLHNLETWKPKQSKTLKLKSVSKHISYQSIFTSFHAQLGTQLGTQKHTGTQYPRARPVELLLMRRGLPKSKHLRNRSRQCSGGCYLVSAGPTSRKKSQKPFFLEDTGIFVSPKNQKNLENMQEWR